MNNYPHIAIALLNYNGREFLEAYLPGVLQAGWPNKSVWVIDNASADDSIAFLQLTYPDVRIVQNGANLGFAEGYNKGLKHIEADFYLMLNNDVETPPSFLAPLAKVMMADEKVAFVQPKIRWLRHRNLFEYAGAAGGVMDILGYPFCRGRLFDKLEADHGQYNDTVPVFWASGACMLVRTSAFWQLDGFYSYLFMHNEEIDLCWRAQSRGFKIMACGSSEVYHVGGGSLKAESTAKVYFNFRNNLIMITRNMPLAWLMAVVVARFGLDLLAAIRFALQQKTALAAAVMRAWLHYLGWLIQAQPNKWPHRRKLFGLKGVYKGSAVWRRYLCKQK
jgi:GT2 family glycosyltransferase